MSARHVTIEITPEQRADALRRAARTTRVRHLAHQQASEAVPGATVTIQPTPEQLADALRSAARRSRVRIARLTASTD